MTLKRWVLGKASGAKRPARGDARTRVTPTSSGARVPEREMREPTVDDAPLRRDEPRRGVEHLGPYTPLIGAIRDELERFVMSDLRLHLAIAERDRYVLTSIEVQCEGSDEHRELLRKFVREFKPEQVKHYLAKEVIAGLRNASAVDLGQFAGLNAVTGEEPEKSGDEDGYEALLADLRSNLPKRDVNPYRVTLIGRWSPSDALRGTDARRDAPTGASPRFDGTPTPLAGRSFALDIEDARGSRRVALESIVPGRRYSIGKGDGSDFVVDGLYASRRHCEIWYERGAWWVADSGSTNGVRVDAFGPSSRRESSARSAGQTEPLELPPGALLVLSAHARGEPREYPRLTLQNVSELPRHAESVGNAEPTPVTPIAPRRRRDAKAMIHVRMASGERDIAIDREALPFSIGRSRTQALVVDRVHAEVSGHHLEIGGIDERGAAVVVHGDNGVRRDGTSYGPGERLQWKFDETLTLGDADETTGCTLTLSRIG